MEYGLLGKKLVHSFSKEIHSLLGDYEYDLIEKNEDEVHEFLEKADFKAINVTIPYKETVLPYLSYVGQFAQKAGCVNTIVKKKGRLEGFNTDFTGFMDLLKRKGIDVKNKNVLILGTGGTSKTCMAVCKNENAKSVIRVSRTEKEGAISYEKACTMTETQVLINTTPVGMYPDNKNVPIDIDLFPKLSAVIDVIYNPLKTPLLTKAEKKGLGCTNGLYMLVRQGIRASEHFFDRKIDTNFSESVYRKLYNEKRNIVLIGMPSCGKTTIGKILSEKTGRKLIDTDDEITKKYNMTIPEIFEKYGENGFRDREQEVVFDMSRQNGVIIATGGGVILRGENVDMLKQNGTLFFLNRPLEKLIPTADRPTASSKNDIEKLFRERYEQYISAADVIINTNNDVLFAANETEKRFFDEN